MPVKNRIADMLPEITAWRQDFHAHPELLFDVQRTAARVAELLQGFGVDEVTTGIGRTGVVGVIRGRTDTIGRSRPSVCEEVVMNGPVTETQWYIARDGKQHGPLT